MKVLRFEDKQTGASGFIEAPITNNGFEYYRVGIKTKRAKKYKYYFYKDLETSKKAVEIYLNNQRKKLKANELRKEQQRKKIQEFKKKIKVGTLLRTTFSYNLTFNYFYQVKEIKGNTYYLYKLSKKIVSGDYFTCSVKPVLETNGEIIKGKLTSVGLKIDNLYAKIISENDTFYENHLD